MPLQQLCLQTAFTAQRVCTGVSYIPLLSQASLDTLAPKVPKLHCHCSTESLLLHAAVLSLNR